MKNPDVTERSVAPRVKAEALRKDALALLEKGEFDGALELYDHALAHARDAAEPAFVDWIYVCRAAAAAERGPADEELLELKRILLRSGDPETAFRAAYTGAGIYELRRDYRKALFYNRIARQRATELGDPLLVSGSENQLGNIQVADSRFEEAAQAYTRALSAGAEISPVFQAVTRDNLGYCHLAMDRIADGLELVHDSFAFLESQQATAFTVLPLLDLCFGYLKCDRYEEARYFGEAGLQRADSSGDPSTEKNFLYLLGETCHLSGDTAAAQTYFDRLASLYPEFRNLRAYLEVFDFRNVINLRS
jgi:tetratricopeptide (TPR) repeat protein